MPEASDTMMFEQPSQPMCIACSVPVCIDVQERTELAEFKLHSFAVPDSKVTGRYSQHFDYVSVDYENPKPIISAIQV